MNLLEPKYNHQLVEKDKYAKWVEKEYFKSGDLTKKPFSIVIPPPNVTGKLHLGHAWNTTLQDLIIRYKRMQGFDALWLPGMDHAGIATQAKVEERLRNQGISRYDLGREEFLKVAWSWKEEYASLIREQWGKLGLSLDYSKERFTLDEGLNKAVNEVFTRLYKKGLIYRGERIINWDPLQKTALSNIEVIYKETESYLYHFKYFIEGETDVALIVATTRPETMFADVCLVVNPSDPRYKAFIGKNAINPSNSQIIPIIADEYVDINFGTGVMKCTPAHDPNDFILGEKYHFARPVCMNNDGTINELGHIYCGLDRFEARKKLVEYLKKVNLVEKIEKHMNQVGYSERSNAIVEPFLSKQWFVKMKPLASQALNLQNSEDKIKFFPDRFEKIFTNWMEGIEDWCISRQLWWGHRIPAYYNEQGEVYVGVNPPVGFIQDEDVLDTWFSSALWPFSTLGWPENNENLNRYYPNDVLCTAYDIIFFWVSRMIFQGVELTNQKPFKHTLIHGLIRDEQGRKMSKSLGNGVDPMDVIDKYGADALRFFLTTNSSPGLDLRYSEDKVEASWNFINKIWNASRFVMMNLGDSFISKSVDVLALSSLDKWIIGRLNQTICFVEENMEKYEFVMAGSYLYGFVYDDFCSWYIEMAKLSLNDEKEEIVENTKNVLYYVLESIIKLIHPFMPFVSEEIYCCLHKSSEVTITTSAYPTVKQHLVDQDSVKVMDTMIQIIQTIRTMRSENNIAPSKPIHLFISSNEEPLLMSIQKNARYLERFAFAEKILFGQQFDHQEKGMVYALTDINLFVPLAGLIDVEAEKKRLKEEIAKLELEILRGEKMLSNPGFIQKAPQSKIDEEKAKLEDYHRRLKVSQESLQSI